MFGNGQYCLALDCSRHPIPTCHYCGLGRLDVFYSLWQAPHIHNLVHVSGKFEHIIICLLLVFAKHKGCLEIVDVFILDTVKQGTLSLHHVML